MTRKDIITGKNTLIRTYLDTFINSYPEAMHLFYPGMIIPFNLGYYETNTGRVGPPGGWLLCDGTNGTPDLRGKFILGSGQGVGLTNRTEGQVGGAETHVLTINEMPSHNHTADVSGGHVHSITDPGHSHSYVNNTNDQGTDNAFNTETAADNADLPQTTGISTTGIQINFAGVHTHNINNTGGGEAHNNMPPFYVLTYIMRQFS
jgi:microcystin-dependent protein